MVKRNRCIEKSFQRRGAAAVTVVIMLTVLVGFAALTVDMGMLYNTRGDLQRTADSAALASAQALMDQNRLKGTSELYGVFAKSRTEASAYAAENPVYGVHAPSLDSNDVSVGYFSDPSSGTEAMDYSDPTRYNAVRVKVRRDTTANGAVQLLFARIFGRTTTEVTAEAAAAFMDGVDGYRATDDTGNADLLPLALRTTSWTDLLEETVTAGDNYSYDPVTGLVSDGADGIPELNLYPGSGAGQLPPGNFGTVDIGPPDNSTADLSRQIRYGVSPDDLDYFGGELRFGPDGTLQLNGDTGLSAAIKDDLEAILGLPRAIPLFSHVNGPGNNAMFTIVGFAGIRIMYVKLTGAMSGKKVIIQPALVVDDAVLTSPATGSSYFVYQPVRLVR
jgi:Flp pilus assembly protein TadG